VGVKSEQGARLLFERSLRRNAAGLGRGLSDQPIHRGKRMVGSYGRAEARTGRRASFTPLPVEEGEPSG